MPLIRESSYRPPFFLKNAHLQTVLPNAVRRVAGVHYTRKRLTTPDNDFLDLDWSYIGASKVAVVLHGLEGHSRRPYIRGMVRACNRAGWDAVAVNFRGCSGEPNLLPRFYHNGSSDDLSLVLDHIASLPYQSIRCIGFSLGGNVLLKYLGESGHVYPEALTAAVAISVPCHLASCADNLASKENAFYMKRFLRMLHEKILAKKARFPEHCNDDDFDRIHTFREFDDRYTAPLHGFSDAEDYWEKASSLQFLRGITLPTLMVNSLDDPFLTPHCFPYDMAEGHGALTFEVTRYGGHCGFIDFHGDGSWWHERRAVAFLSDVIR